MLNCLSVAPPGVKLPSENRRSDRETFRGSQKVAWMGRAVVMSEIRIRSVNHIFSPVIA